MSSDNPLLTLAARVEAEAPSRELVGALRRHEPFIVLVVCIALCIIAVLSHVVIGV